MLASVLSRSVLDGCRGLSGHVSAAKCVRVAVASRHLSVSSVNRKTFEPDYLDSSVPLIPTYPPINIQIKSYNFDVLESFQSFIHNLAENMGVDVQDAWATPPQSYKISNFMEGSTRVKTDFKLNMYERNVQLVDLRSTDAPILIGAVRAALPQSVQLSFHQHTEENYEDRFIPDPFIDSIKSELSEGAEKLAAIKEQKEATAAAKAARKQAAILSSLKDDEDDD